MAASFTFTSLVIRVVILTLSLSKGKTPRILFEVPQSKTIAETAQALSSSHTVYSTDTVT
jgi:hypothetical protein